LIWRVHLRHATSLALGVALALVGHAVALGQVLSVDDQAATAAQKLSPKSVIAIVDRDGRDSLSARPTVRITSPRPRRR
jgi:hypothetical protein